MKNLLKTGLFSVALLATIIVKASEKVNVKVAPTSKMLALELTKVIEGESIIIRDINKEVLFFEQLGKAEKYSKVFSFKELPNGLYFIENRDLTKIEVTPIIINDEGVAVVENAVKTYLAPKVSLEEGILKVNVRNYLKVPVTIAIYDEFGALLSLKENNTNTLVFGAYETSNLKSEKLTVSISEGDQSFIDLVKL